jgi:hypothetical protein
MDLNPPRRIPVFTGQVLIPEKIEALLENRLMQLSLILNKYVLLPFIL